MNLRQAAEMALEALEAMNPYPASKEDQRASAIATLRAALAEADEPVAWLRKNGFRFLEAAEPQNDSELPLYTHPPRREPLTEEEVEALIDAQWSPDLSLSDLCRDVARAVERAHGIGTDE